MKKKCSKCGKSKQLEFFEVSKVVKSGYGARCKACMSDIRREYREANPEKRREHYLQNKERCNEQSRTYFQENKHWLVPHRKKYAQDHKEKMREYSRKSERRTRDSLGDTYIRKTLSQYSTIGRADIPQVLVEAKREQLKLLRSIKNGKSKSKNN